MAKKTIQSRRKRSLTPVEESGTHASKRAKNDRDTASVAEDEGEHPVGNPSVSSKVNSVRSDDGTVSDNEDPAPSPVARKAAPRHKPVSRTRTAESTGAVAIAAAVEPTTRTRTTRSQSVQSAVSTNSNPAPKSTALKAKAKIERLRVAITDCPSAIDDNLRSRIETIINFKDRLMALYPINDLPANVGWKTPIGDTASETLHAPDVDHPIRILVVGVLVKSWFYNGRDPARQVSVTLRPISPLLLISAERALSKFSTNTKAHREFLWISRWQAPAGKVAAPVFKSYYSATEKFLPPSASQELDVQTDLERGDIVIAESLITRYEPSGDTSNASPQRSPNRSARRSGEQIAQLSLHNLYLLKRGPRSTELEEVAVGPSTWAAM